MNTCIKSIVRQIRYITYIKTYLKVIYIGRKYQKCRRSIDLPSIECTGYEPYEYSWKEKSIGKIILCFFCHPQSISISNAWILLFLVESSISVEYFGASASINRTKRLKNEQIECLDCIYMEKEKRKAHPISGHRYVLLLLTWRVKLINHSSGWYYK